MAVAQAKVQALAEEIGDLTPRDRARLLARLLAQEGRFEDWSVVDAIRKRNANRSPRALENEITRAVREVRRDRVKRTSR